MIGDPIELAELVETTLDLISEYPTEITLLRAGWERVPGGGVRQTEPVPQPPKERYFGAISSDARYVQYTEGEQVVSEYVLVGPPGDDIQEKDTFVYGNKNFLVYEVHPDRSYETRAWVIHRA